MRFNRTVFAFQCSVFVVASLATANRAMAQDSLQAVKELYASAAYEDALTAVGKIDTPTEPNLEAEQYRVFCLVALGRMDDAAKAVESVLMLRPEYRPNSADASPRIQTLFSQVRRRIGPALVKQLYQQGRAAMDRKDREEAVTQFEAMLRMANDEDVRSEPSVAELRELGAGFLELSKAMPAKGKPAEPVAAAPAAPKPSVIVPPTVIQQRLPPWIPDPVSRATEFRGAVRVQISTEGKVTSVEVLKSVHPAYDQSLIRAARAWLYEPAKKDGVPIPSEKTVEVAVKAPVKAGTGPGADKSPQF